MSSGRADVALPANLPAYACRRGILPTFRRMGLPVSNIEVGFFGKTQGELDNGSICPNVNRFDDASVLVLGAFSVHGNRWRTYRSPHGQTIEGRRVPPLLLGCHADTCCVRDIAQRCPQESSEPFDFDI